MKLRNFKIQNLYNNFVKDLKRMENLTIMKYGYLLCARCHSEICEIKEKYPLLTNKNNGEHLIESSWMNDNLKLIYNKKNKIEKSLNLDENEINKFKEKLKKENIKYENLLCCHSGRHVVGYLREKEKYIYYGSELIIKYPDLTYETINEKSYVNDFADIRNKIEEIMEEKQKPEFKSQIFCKLCGFYVKNNIYEFKAHLKDKEHDEKMKELRREFI